MSRHGQLRVPPEMSGGELWLKSGASSHGPRPFSCHVYELALFAVRSQRPIVVFDTSDKGGEKERRGKSIKSLSGPHSAFTSRCMTLKYMQ